MASTGLFLSPYLFVTDATVRCLRLYENALLARPPTRKISCESADLLPVLEWSRRPAPRPWLILAEEVDGESPWANPGGWNKKRWLCAGAAVRAPSSVRRR